MNKSVVDSEIALAFEAIKNTGIAEGQEKNKVNKAFRGQISSFGAAVTTGSLLAAVTFFSKQGEASVDRSKLLATIFEVLTGDNKLDKNKYSCLFDYVKANQNNPQCKENILNASIAVKLAMNLFELTK